jgi:hypothetical protein
LYALPNSGYASEQRLSGLMRASGSLITRMTSYSGGLPRHFVASINGVCQTNEPIALLLIGSFDYAQIATGLLHDIDAAGLNAPGMVNRFGPNLLVETFDAVGETGIRILENATDVEIFRLWSHADDSPNNADKLDGYRIKKVGKRGGRDVVAIVADEILAPGGSAVSATACLVDPGLGFRISTREGSVSAAVCLGCGQILYAVHDQNGKELKRDGRHLSDESKKRLANAGLKGLPGDRALAQVSDRELRR